MDKFDGVQRADIVSIDYACELTSQTPIIGKKKDKMTALTSDALSRADGKTKSKQGFGWFRYVFCALVLGVCLLGKFTSADPLKTASGFIKDELSKDFISELYDG